VGCGIVLDVVLTSVVVVLALCLTLVLPIYPEGITPEIAAFLGLAALAGAGGLIHRAARRELMVLTPWAVAILTGLLVGSLRNGESQQAVEDCLPYVLFVLGLVAGRGLAHPRAVLVAALWVCVIDSAVCLWNMPSFDVGVRSTYTYWKITAGLPLVGIPISLLLRHTDPQGRPSALLLRPLHALAYLVLLAGMFTSVSRGMMLGWVLALVVTAYVRRPSQVLAGGILIAVMLVAWSTTLEDIGTRYLRTSQAGTIEGRLREVETAWETFVRYPMFGAGLGAMFEVDGFYKAFVHNMAAYHLWKFGLVGSTVLALPFFLIARQLQASPRAVRGIVIGGALGIVGYLVTCAAYKTYYLVWIYGIVGGATLSWLGEWRRMQTPAPGARGGPS
jgi:hypothetical protein